MWWSSWGAQFLQGEGKEDGGSMLQTPALLKARIPSGKGPWHYTLTRHTPKYHRETQYLRNISQCSHTSPGLCPNTGTEFQTEQKQHPQCLSVMVFPAFWWDPVRGWMQWEAAAAAGPLLACLSLSCSYFCFSVSRILSFFLAGRLLLNTVKGRAFALINHMFSAMRVNNS